MCYPTNTPCYTPPPRREGLSKEPPTGGQRGGLQRNGKRQRQWISCGIALYSQSLFAGLTVYFERWSGEAMERSLRWLQRPEASLGRTQERSMALLLLLLSLGPPAGKRPSERQPGCADRASPKETRRLRNRRGSQRKSLEASRVLFGLFP